MQAQKFSMHMNNNKHIGNQANNKHIYGRNLGRNRKFRKETNGDILDRGEMIIVTKAADIS